MESETQRSVHIAIVCGGVGTARNESLASARAIELQLAHLGYPATLIDTQEVAPEAIEWPAYQLCHIACADDGRLHRHLQGRGVLHTGSSAEAVELAASRTGARQFLLRFDVPTPAFVMLRDCVSPLEAVARVASLRYPLVVRPDDRQLSGARLVRNADELTDTLHTLFRDTSRVMCERLLPGRAYSIILQGEHALPPVPSHLEGIESPLPTPALTETQSRQLQHVASMAGIALGMSGLVQVEVVLDEQGRSWVLEVNPLPALTEASPAALAAARDGLSLSELCQWMVSDCLLSESLR